MTTSGRSQGTVGAVVAEMLATMGVDHFFLLTGGDNDFFLNLRHHRIAAVLARSERSAVYMADAYSRLRGTASFAYGQFGPGAAVVLSGLVDAHMANTPVVALTSDVRSSVRHRHAYQELDQTAMFSPFTKWSARVETPNRAPDMLRTAVRRAISGRPGPTYLGIPTDVMLEPVDTVTVSSHVESIAYPAARPRPDESEIAVASEVLSRAARPVLVAGSGVMSSRAWDDVTGFAEALDIPVVTSVGGKGAMAESHRLCHGVAGRYSRVSANRILRQADVIVAVGTRLNDMLTDRERGLAPDARVIQIDIEADSASRNLQMVAMLVADIRPALHDLLAAMDSGIRFEEWADEAASISGAWVATRDATVAASKDIPISPLVLVSAIRTVLADDDLLVTDTGYSAAWTGTFFDVTKPGIGHLRTAGSLGWALPAALGAQLALPENRVVCFIGDGGIGYHIADIETAVRLRLPVVFVLNNNSTLAFERQVQELVLGEVDETLTDFSDSDYAGVARAFGAQGHTVESAHELGPTLRKALDSGEPCLVDVRTDRDAIPPVTNYEHIHPRDL